MAWAKVGAFGALSSNSNTGSITPAFGQATTAGNTLIAMVAAQGGAIGCSTSGWVQAKLSNNTQAAIWYKVNCGAGETAPTFTAAGAVYMAAVLSEWSGGGTSPTVDQTGTASGTVSPAVLVNGGNDTDSSDLAIAVLYEDGTKSHTLTATSTWTPASGTAANVGTDKATKQIPHIVADSYLLNTHGGAAADQDSITLTVSTGALSSYDWAIVSFKVTAAATPKSDSDTASGADAGESIAVAITDAETGSGADAGEALADTLTDNDPAAGTDAGESIAATTSDADTASGADAGESIGVTDNDPAAGVDAGEALAVALTDDDPASGADAGEAAQATLSDDDAVVSDSGESVAVTLSDDDPAAGVDGGEVIGLPISDSDAARMLANARTFNGTSDVISLALGAGASLSTAWTVAAIVRPTQAAIQLALAIGDTSRITLGLTAANQVRAGNAGSSVNGTAALTASAWGVIVASKVAGTATPRMHLYVFSSGTWTHEAASGTITNTTPNSSAAIGARPTPTAFWKGDIAVAAAWAASLSDAQIEALATSLGAWSAYSPAGLWWLDQGAAATSVVDSTGGGADQTAISGTSIATSLPPLGETASIAAAVTDDDPATGADAGESTAASTSDADTASATDAEAQIALAGDDPATAADDGSIAVTLTDPDTGSAVDAEALAAMFSDADTGAGVDAGESLAATLTDAETGAGADAGESTAAATSDSDTASATDLEGSIALSGDDPGTGTDTEAIAAAATDSDTGNAADLEGSIALSANDPGAGSDAGEALAAAVTDDDPASGADGGEHIDTTGSDVNVSDAETASGSDAGEALAAMLTDDDPASGTENQSAAAGASDGDVGSGLDNASLAATMSDSDAASALEDSSVAVLISDDDLAAMFDAETLSILFSDTDTAVAFDDGTVLVISAEPGCLHVEVVTLGEIAVSVASTSIAASVDAEGITAILETLAPLGVTIIDLGTITVEVSEC